MSTITIPRKSGRKAKANHGRLTTDQIALLLRAVKLASLAVEMEEIEASQLSVPEIEKEAKLVRNPRALAPTIAA